MDEEDMSPYLVQLSPLVGRCLIAKRNLQQGELILKELPLVHGPSRDSPPVCLGCYASLESDAEDPDCCDFCGLPICSANKDLCQSSVRHRPECQALQRCGRAKGMSLLDDASLLYEVVLVLRCLALQNAEMEDFLRLEPHLEAREADDETQRRVEFVCSFVVTDAGISDAATVSRICGILDVNSFEVQGTSGVVQAVYRTACLLEHHCIPNTHRCFHTDDFSLDLRAATSMVSGQHITTSYTDSLWPTMERRAHLFSSKHFECICSRCADPTEAGTFLSSVMCSKCPVGNLVSEDPLDPESNWSCPDCGNTLHVDYVNRVNEQVAQTVALMEQESPSPEQCEKFITIHSRVLHPKHAHMVDVKHTLLHLLGHSEGYLMAELTDRQLQLKEELGRMMVDIAEKLLPGINRLKGTTVYELFLVYQQRALNWKNSGSRGKTDILAALNIARECLDECLSILQYEPIDNPEGKLFQRATEERTMLVEFVTALNLE